MFVDSHSWDLLMPLLAEQHPDRRFVLVDPPGLGASEPLHRRSSILEAADAARDALEQLGAVGPVDWVGNAFGGHVGLELARDASVLRTLVAISSPVQPVPPALRRRIALLGPLLRVAGPVAPVRRAVVEAMLTDAAAADPRIRSIVVESLERPTRRSTSLALRSFIVDRADVSERLGDIAVPSLFVASDDRGDWSPDDAMRAAELVGPHARAVTVARARTLVPLEQPAALATLMGEFWAGAGRG